MNKLKIFFIYSLIFWPFIYSNARLSSQDGGTAIYSLFHFIGPEFRFIESIIFILLNLFILIRFLYNRTNLDDLSKSIFILFFLIILICIVSTAQGLVPISYIFRASYELLCPFLLFNISKYLDLNHQIINNLLKILFSIMVLNVIVVMHQFLFLFNGVFVDGDYFRGIFSDAHVQAMFSFSSTLFIISNTNYLKKFFYFVPINIFCAFLSSNEKASIFFLIILFAIIILKLNRKNVLSLLVLLIFLTLNSSQIINTFSPRILEYTFSLSLTDLIILSGPSQMLLILFDQFALSWKNIFFGIGPSLFGGPSCISLIQNLLAPSYIEDMFYVEAFGDYNFLPLSGFFSKSSFYLTVLGEFGIFVFLFFMILLKNFLKRLKSLSNSNLKNPLFVIFIFILLCAILTSYSVWDSQVILTPFFVLLSYLISNNKERVYE